MAYLSWCVRRYRIIFPSTWGSISSSHNASRFLFNCLPLFLRHSLISNGRIPAAGKESYPPHLTKIRQRNWQEDSRIGNLPVSIHAVKLCKTAPLSIGTRSYIQFPPVHFNMIACRIYCNTLGLALLSLIHPVIHIDLQVL